MNSNILNEIVMHTIQVAVEPIVTNYLQQHPEYFSDCVSGSGKICQYEVTLSYQPDKLKDITTVKPTIFIRLGGLDKCHELICFDHHPEDIYSKFTVAGSTVTDQEIPNV